MTSFDPNSFRDPAEEVVPPLSTAEIAALRRLLAVARYDEAGRAFVIDTGRARVLVREDGTIRCEGAEVIVTAERHITLDAAAIELN